MGKNVVTVRAIANSFLGQFMMLADIMFIVNQ